MVDVGGVSYKIGILKSNQFLREECHKKDCPFCFRENGGSSTKCSSNYVLYEGECEMCQDKCV